MGCGSQQEARRLEQINGANGTETRHIYRAVNGAGHKNPVLWPRAVWQQCSRGHGKDLGLQDVSILDKSTTGSNGGPGSKADVVQGSSVWRLAALWWRALLLLAGLPAHHGPASHRLQAWGSSAPRLA